MPYFVYRRRPFAQIEKLAEFDAYQPASAQAKALRAALGAAPGEKINVMFAASERLAEDLLCQVREAEPAGADD